MLMTVDEIKISYRDALNKQKQVPILAQLNACSTEKINGILGIDEDTTSHYRKKGLSAYRHLFDQMLELYNSGMSDRAIAEKLKVHRSHVTRWRGSLGLPPNKQTRKAS